MRTIKKNLAEWRDELQIRFYSSSQRQLEANEIHIGKITAKEFIRILRTSEYTFENRNVFNKKIISFSKKYNIRREHISKFLELRKDDYVKFKADNKIFIGRYQGELNNGNEIIGIEINGDGALNFLYIKKEKIFFPTKKEISKALKKEIESKSGRSMIPVPESYYNQISYNSYYE